MKKGNKIYTVRHKESKGDIWKNSYQAKYKAEATKLSKLNGNDNIISVELF